MRAGEKEEKPLAMEEEGVLGEFFGSGEQG